MDKAKVGEMVVNFKELYDRARYPMEQLAKSHKQLDSVAASADREKFVHLTKEYTSTWKKMEEISKEFHELGLEIRCR